MKRLVRDVPPRALLAVLLLVLIAGVVTGREEPVSPTTAIKDGSQAIQRPTAETAERTTPGSSPASLAGSATPGKRDPEDLDLSRLQRQPREGTVNDLFASLSLAPPPPPAPPVKPAAPVAVTPPPPPPPPSAPPLPYRYLGRMVDGGTVIAFVARNDEHWSVKAGSTVEDTYRVESVGDTAVVFIHLPTGIRQTLSISPQG